MKKFLATDEIYNQQKIFTYFLLSVMPDMIMLLVALIKPKFLDLRL